jgi:hypothetical protein
VPRTRTLSEANAALRASEERLRRALESETVGIIFSSLTAAYRGQRRLPAHERLPPRGPSPRPGALASSFAPSWATNTGSCCKGRGPIFGVSNFFTPLFPGPDAGGLDHREHPFCRRPSHHGLFGRLAYPIRPHVRVVCAGPVCLLGGKLIDARPAGGTRIFSRTFAVTPRSTRRTWCAIRSTTCSVWG